MMEYYRMFYPCFDEKRFEELAKKFGLEMGRRINTFSKGMKKQVSVLLGVCANTKYLLCDETFDGLDPVMRQAVKSIFALEIMNRNFTPVIASHNLRELEDICDHVGLLHKGGILFEAVLRGKNPVFYEILPLTLEEIFISETEVVGYDVKSLLL